MAMKFTLGLIVASLACVSAVATETQAGAEAGNNPSYIMPAAFPTPYYSQFLPPYQNFNPFYPLPSVSYVGPQRHPFRQWSPYYYYGGPVQWGTGPATSAPNPTSTVASVTMPSAVTSTAVSFVESAAHAEEAVDMEAQLSALLADEPVPSALVETEAEVASEAEAEAEGDWQTAALRHEGPINSDPIAARRAAASAQRYADSARWADKFDRYNSAYTKKEYSKRIKEMRGEAFLEVASGANAEATAEAEAEAVEGLVAEAHAEIAALAELGAESEAEAVAAVEAEIDAGLEAEAEVEAENEAETELESEADSESEADEATPESFVETGAEASVSAGAEAQASAAAMAEAESMVYQQIEAAVRAQKEIQSLLELRKTMDSEAARLLEEGLDRIVSEQVSAAFEEARAELVKEGKFPKQQFSLIEGGKKRANAGLSGKSTPQARKAFLSAFDNAFESAVATQAKKMHK